MKELSEKTMKQEFSKEELEKIANSIPQTYQAIAGDLEEACNSCGEKFTASMAIESILDAGYMITYGGLDQEIYNRMVKFVKWDSMKAFAKKHLNF